MNALLLFRESGNWMGFLVILIVACLLLIGIERLYTYLWHPFSHRNPRIFHRKEEIK